ncbi:hypothetical protein QYF36_003264 [Acer negundo]|nr:hypothetical protein QYF36_003264 [Acer negundo]
MASSRFHLTVVQFLTLIAFPISSFAVQTLTDNPNFDPEIAVLGDAKFVDDYSHVQLTGQWLSSSGLLIHNKPFKLFDPSRSQPTSFSTDFTFSISPSEGDGLAFVVLPYNSAFRFVGRGSFGVLSEKKYMGCAALLAFVMLFVWAIVVNKHTEFPTEIHVHPEDFKYEKISVVVDEDGKGVQVGGGGEEEEEEAERYWLLGGGGGGGRRSQEQRGTVMEGDNSVKKVHSDGELAVEIPETAHQISSDSWFQVGFVLTTGINSAYVLGYSGAVMVPLGWVFGVVGLIIATIVSLNANILVAKLHEFGGRRHIRYRDLAGFIYGKRAYSITWGLQYVNLFMINTGYIILSGQALKATYFLFSDDHDMKLPYFIAIAGFVCALFAIGIPHLSALRIWLGFSTFFSLVYIVIATVLSARDGINSPPRDYSIPGTTTSKIFTTIGACASLVFAFNTGMLPEIQATIKEPVVENMLKALYFQFSVGVLPLYAVAFMGYWAYGSSTSTYLLNNVSGPVWVKAAANISAFLQSVIALHIFASPMYEYLDTRYGIKGSALAVRNLSFRFVVRGGYLTINTLVSALLPFLGDFMSLTGAISTFPLTFILANHMYLVAKKSKLISAQKLWHWINVGFFSFMSVAAAIAALRLIAVDSKTYHVETSLLACLLVNNSLHQEGFAGGWYMMAKIRDRTEDFKDAVRHIAVSLGYNESKLAAIMASFIIHKPRQRSSFMKAALKTLESVGALEQFMSKHRKDYVDLHRTTERERDSIEHEVTAFIKVCKEQIDILKNSISDDEENTKGWLGIRTDNSNADTIAHKHGVVLILSEKLHSVTARFDQLRAIRFQDTINKATPRRKLNRVPKSSSAGISQPNNSEIRELDELQPQPISVQQQLLDDETRALQVELTSLLDAVHQTETKMVEMSALNHLMSTHILQQTQQIEHLYDQAVEATKNVELGNKEISKAIQRNSSSRTFLLLFLFVLTFSILFLDWFLSRTQLIVTHSSEIFTATETPYKKMVKGRQGERVRLYVRGTILGYKRSKSNQYPNTSLIQIEGVNTKEEVAWSLDLMETAVLFVPSSSPIFHQSPWVTGLGSSCTPAISKILQLARLTSFVT